MQIDDGRVFRELDDQFGRYYHVGYSEFVDKEGKYHKIPRYRVSDWSFVPSSSTKENVTVNITISLKA